MFAGKELKGKVLMDCYGRSYGRRDDCKRCKLSKYCRDAGDPPLFSQLSDADPDKRVTAVTAVDEIAVLPPEPEPEMMYSRAELLEVISFMVHLDERTLDFLEAKLTGADFCLSHLAQERKVSRQAVHKLLKDRLRRFPELEFVLRTRGERNKTNQKRSFLEDVWRIQKAARERRSSKPKTSSSSWRNSNCSILSFALSKTSTFKGSAIWNKD